MRKFKPVRINKRGRVEKKPGTYLGFDKHDWFYGIILFAFIIFIMVVGLNFGG